MQRIVKKNWWQKKWSGHGRTGQTADYGPASTVHGTTSVLGCCCQVSKLTTNSFSSFKAAIFIVSLRSPANWSLLRHPIHLLSLGSHRFIYCIHSFLLHRIYFFQRFHAGFCFYPTQKSQNSTITHCKQTKRFRPAEASDLIMLTRCTGRPTILKVLNFRIGPIQSPAL